MMRNFPSTAHRSGRAFRYILFIGVVAAWCGGSFARPERATAAESPEAPAAKPAAGPISPQPIEPWLNKPMPAIDWGKDWDDTLQRNQQAWAKQLADKPKEERQRLLDAWMRDLLAALLDRYPKQAKDQRLKTYRKIIDLSRSLDQGYRLAIWRQRLAKDFPDDDARFSALAGLLGHDGWRTMQRWAAEQVLAAGLPPKPSAGQVKRLNDARRALFDLAIQSADLSRAAELLKALQAASDGDSDSWLIRARGKLMLAAGRAREARGAYEQVLKLYTEAGDQHNVNLTKLTLNRLNADVSLPTVMPDPALQQAFARLRQTLDADHAASADAFIASAATSDGMTELSDNRFTSYWLAMDRQVGDRPSLAAAMRDAEASRATTMPERSAADDSLSDLMRRYRATPWAPAVHGDMLTWGERLLRQSKAGLARRMFEDVLSHAGAAATRERARVGCWLAMAASGEGEQLHEALQAADKDQTFPWRGGRATVSQIAATLKKVADQNAPRMTAPRLDPRSQATHQPAAAVPMREVDVPALSSWPLSSVVRMPVEQAEVLRRDLDVQAVGSRVLVSSPGFIACYAQGRNDPIWVLHSRTVWSDQPVGAAEARDLKRLIAPGRFHPRIAGSRVYTRWGLDLERTHLTSVAAFDLATGRMLWSTADDATWGALQPMGDVAVADGRVYVLATNTGLFRNLSLICLDADTGRMLWQRQLLSQVGSLLIRDTHGHATFDVSDFGSIVRVRDGAVYCLSSLGMVARVDARDGMVRWMTLYPRALMLSAWQAPLNRDGILLPTASAILCAPRDTTATFALDPDTGKVLWRDPMLGAANLVGTAGANVLLADAHRLTAVELKSGAVRWDHDLPPHNRLAMLDAATVVVVGDGSMQRIDAETGRATPSATRAPAEPSVGLAAADGKLIFAVAPPQPLDPPDDAGLIALSNPQLVPTVTEAHRKALFALSGQVLTCLTPDLGKGTSGDISGGTSGGTSGGSGGGGGGGGWQRYLEPGEHGALQIPGVPGGPGVSGTVLVWHSATLRAFDAVDGKLRWQRTFDRSIKKVVADATQVLVLLRASGRYKPLVRLKLDTGEVSWRWQRNYGGRPVAGFRIVTLWALGSRVGVLGRGNIDRKPVTAWLNVDAKRGTILSMQLIPVIQWKLGSWFDHIEVDRAARTMATAAGSKKPMVFLQIEPDAVHVMNYGLEPEVDHTAIAVRGRWLLLRDDEPWHSKPVARWAFHVGRSTPVAHWKKSPAVAVVGDHIFAIEAVKAQGKHKPVSATLVSYRGGDHAATDRWPFPAGTIIAASDVLDARRVGSKLVVLSRPLKPTAEHPAQAVRMDVFDATRGRYLAGRTLTAISGATDHTQPSLQWLGDTLVAATGDGVRYFAVPTAAPPAVAPWKLPSLDHEIAVDGQFDDWAGPSWHEVDGVRHAKVAVALTPDNIVVAARVPADSAQPRLGNAFFAQGTWLECGLSHGQRVWRAAIGTDHQGHTRITPLAPDQDDTGAQAVERYDPVRHELIYELSIPRQLVKLPRGYGTFGLSLACWDTSAAHPRRQPLIGRALAGTSVALDQQVMLVREK